MTKRIEDLCAEPARLPAVGGEPLAPPLCLSSVYRCRTPAQAEAMLAGDEAGYVYSRVGHPAADMLADKLRQLHGSEQAAVAASGMAALAALLLTELQQGDHVVVSRQLYGTTLDLVTDEAARLGITSTVVDTLDLAATRAACQPGTRLLVVETITNPMLRVSDLAALAECAQGCGARLVVDNTFASPVVCRPIEWGADWVVESLTKIISGHSDVVLGALCGPADAAPRLQRVLARWGLGSSPFDCWLALRGLATLPLRSRQASSTAHRVAEFLSEQNPVAAVHYPGLASHPDHALAVRQFGDSCGTLVSFTLAGGRKAAEALLAAVQGEIPFCPSLGALSTTLSHPQSTSHRTLSSGEQRALGIEPGTLRLSVGIESAEQVLATLARGLRPAEGT